QLTHPPMRARMLQDRLFRVAAVRAPQPAAGLHTCVVPSRWFVHHLDRTRNGHVLALAVAKRTLHAREPHFLDKHRVTSAGRNRSHRAYDTAAMTLGATKGRLIRCTVPGSTPNRLAMTRTPGLPESQGPHEFAFRVREQLGGARAAYPHSWPAQARHARDQSRPACQAIPRRGASSA